jgi:hypothetical protein
MEVSAVVRHEVRTRFSPDVASAVEQLLAATELPGLSVPGHERQRDRVHLAALKVAGGDVTRFGDALRLAARDWRDLLVAADLAGENWPMLLRAAGYPVP